MPGDSLAPLDLSGAFGTSFCSLETATQAEARQRQPSGSPQPSGTSVSSTATAAASNGSPQRGGASFERRNNPESFRFDPIATVVSVEIPAQRGGVSNWAARPQARAKEKVTLTDSAGKLLGGEKTGIFNFCCPGSLVKIPQDSPQAFWVTVEPAAPPRVILLDLPSMSAAEDEDARNAEKGMNGPQETELCPLVDESGSPTSTSFGETPERPSDGVGRRTQDVARVNSEKEKNVEADKPKGEASSSDSSSFVNMKYVALVSLTAIQTLGPLQTAWTRRENIAAGGPRYLNSSIILFGEMVKVVAAFTLLTTEEGGVKGAARSVHRQVTSNMIDNVKICLPALLYAVQGNLLYYSMDKLSPPIFTVSYQLKILTTALLSTVLLGKKIGPIKWVALVILTMGVSLVQLQDPEASGSSSSAATTPPPGTEGINSNAVKGFIAVLAACCTSGLAGVSLEKMLTQTSTSIWMRNVQLGLIGMVMAFLTAVTKDTEKIIEGGIAQGYTHREVLLVLTHALGGLCSAAVLKYAGNILKCFAAAISVVLVSCIAVFMSSFTPAPLFAAGVALVIAAVFLYNVGLPAVVEDYWNNARAWKAVSNLVPSANTAGAKHVM